MLAATKADPRYDALHKPVGRNKRSDRRLADRQSTYPRKHSSFHRDAPRLNRTD